MIVAVVDDVIFRSKIETAAAPLRVPLAFATDEASAAALLTAGAPWPLILVDLNLTTNDPLAIITAIRRRAPVSHIVGYASHQQHALQVSAQEAGCTVVLPRSVFVQQLPALITLAAQH
ncbi:MAG: response regulator transcription factor [Candidatus Omnitrophica bacterium]|nr:response regulator transcription factor [Candidatus Omnitrophota bacterium]